MFNRLMKTCNVKANYRIMSIQEIENIFRYPGESESSRMRAVNQQNSSRNNKQSYNTSFPQQNTSLYPPFEPQQQSQQLQQQQYQAQQQQYQSQQQQFQGQQYGQQEQGFQPYQQQQFGGGNYNQYPQQSVQQYGGQQQYQQTLNIQSSSANIDPSSQLVVCDTCQNRIQTRVEHHAGIVTYLMCCGLMITGMFCGCCLIPFCCNVCQDTYHYCPQCNNQIAAQKLCTQ